jgi:hypothetical protein
MPRSERIYMPITPKQMEIVQKLMKQEGKSKAQIVALIFGDGLKLVDNGK